MNTTEFAKQSGVHYQTVNRIVRKLLAQDGTKAVKGQHFIFTPDFERRVRERLALLKEAEESASARAVNKKSIRSTKAQRRDWAAIWSPAFMTSTDREAWADFACVLASIEHSRFPGWLSERTPKGQRIGDRVLTLAISARADASGNEWGGFTRWLIDNGFEDKK